MVLTPHKLPPFIVILVFARWFRSEALSKVITNIQYLRGKKMGNNQEKISVDVCVIGGAASGLSSGLRAKESGAGKVLIIDKMKKMGGTTRFCAGFIGVEGPHAARPRQASRIRYRVKLLLNILILT